MTSRAAITESERAPSNATRRNAVLSQELAPVGPSRVRIAVPVDLEALRQQADTAFGNGQIFESRADRFSEPVKVKVRATRVYPALRQIGLELDVDVTAAKGGTFSGKLNLAGRPVLDAATGTVTLVDITFPPVSGRDVIGQAPGIPRLGTEPFAAKFAAAAKLDVSRALAEVLPRAIHMLNQRLSDDLALEAKLTQAVPVSLELTRDGAWLLVDLTGDLAFVHDGANDRASLPGNPAATAPDATAATATTPPQTATPEKRPAAKKRPLQSKKTGSAKNT